MATTWDDAAIPSNATLVPAPGFIEHLSLEQTAGAIITDSVRVQQEAAALGIPCHVLGTPLPRLAADQGGTAVALGDDPSRVAAVRPDPRAPTPCAIPLWDGRAGARLAEVCVANFAVIRLD